MGGEPLKTPLSSRAALMKPFLDIYNRCLKSYDITMKHKPKINSLKVHLQLPAAVTTAHCAEEGLLSQSKLSLFEG